MPKRALVAAIVLSSITLLKPLANAERHIYIADHATGKLIEIKEDGTLLWDVTNNNGHDLQILPNGHILLVNGAVVQEVDRDRHVIWEAGEPIVSGAESAQRLPNGHTVISDNGKHRVIEIDKEKNIVWEYDVPNSNNRPTQTMRQMRRLTNGNTLICASTLDRVIEVSPCKEIVWSYDVPFPYLATRLPNGNTLISSGDGYGSPQGFFLIEVDKAGKTVWKYGGADAPADQQLNWPSGFVRMKNGDIYVGVAHDGVLRVISRDKKTLRTITSPALKHPGTIAVVDETAVSEASK